MRIRNHRDMSEPTSDRQVWEEITEEKGEVNADVRHDRRLLRGHCQLLLIPTEKRHDIW